jgi:hypothetical protein
VIGIVLLVGRQREAQIGALGTGPLVGHSYRIYALDSKMIAAHHVTQVAEPVTREQQPRGSLAEEEDRTLQDGGAVPRYTLLASIIVSAIMSGTVRAQDGDDASASHSVIDVDAPTAADAHSSSPRTTFGAWLGLSFDARTTSPNRSIDRDIVVFGLRASRPFWVTRATRLSYVAEVTPVMLLADPTRPASPPPACPPGEVCTLGGGSFAMSPQRAFLAGRLTYGVGLAPLGMELEIGGPDHPLGGVLNLAGGGAYFTGPIPGNTRFNFTAAGGAALQWRTGSGRRLMAGYKLYHMSNAGLGDINPGLNAHLFYLSFVR